MAYSADGRTNKVWGHSLIRITVVRQPKQNASYTPAPAMVHLCKPAHYREVAIIQKTGGCNNEAGVVEKCLLTSLRLHQRELEQIESNGWCRPHYKTNQPIGMRKGSVPVRGFAAKGLYAVRMVSGLFVYTDREELLSSRQAKGTWCVVSCAPKAYAATGAAHHSRLI